MTKKAKKSTATSAKKAKKSTATSAEPRRRRGRPPVPDGKRSPLQVRVAAEQRARWQAAARRAGQRESEWAREGLDGWILVTVRAAELGVKPLALVTAALADHTRIRAAIAELSATPTRSPLEEHLLQLLTGGA